MVIFSLPNFVRKKRIFPVFLGASAGVFCIVSTILWYKTEQKLTQTVDTYQITLRTLGWHVDAFKKKRTGWPFSAKLILTPVNLTGSSPLLGGPVSWQSKRVTLRVSPLHPLTMTMEINGAQALSLYAQQTEQHPLSSLRFWANEFKVTFPFSKPFTAASLWASQLQLAIPGAGPDNIVLVPKLNGRMKWNSQAPATSVLLAFHLDATEVKLPGQNAWPFDRTLSGVHLSFALTGPVPNFAMNDTGLNAWQNTGGRLLIQQAQAMWGPMTITLSGTLGHNDQQQTKGSFLLTLSHLDTVLNSLQNAKALTDSQHKVVKAITDLLSHSTTAQTWQAKHMISLPIDMTDNGFYLGALPINTVFSWLQHYTDYNVTNHLALKRGEN